ncbi:hypothetical protein [Streptomyces globosus]|uniref:hypothetical protein n=1 Tax=Streptomyces globosus TaxID=68209 RepID=UPI00381C0107
MNAPASGESGCQLMRRLAKELEKSIKATERHADEVADAIAALAARPDLDQQQIAALGQTREVLLKKIEEERTSLSDLESVISENC